MSQASIERVLGKLILDAGFRDALLANPEQTLAGFPLTTSEKDYIKRMDAETLDSLSNFFWGHTHLWQSKALVRGQHIHVTNHQE